MTAAVQVHTCLTHLAAHPWPIPGDQVSLPGRIGADYRWLRAHPVGRWALLSVWLGLADRRDPAAAAATSRPLAVHAPAATSPAAGIPATRGPDARPAAGDGGGHPPQTPAGLRASPQLTVPGRP